MPELSVIIPTLNEAKRIANVIRSAKLIGPSHEVVIVDNGSIDGTAAIARRLGCRVVQMKQKLGHDVGRAIGATVATGRILLFIDGDMIIQASDLRPFVDAIRNGADISLNTHLGKINKDPIHNVVLSKHAFQYFVGHPENKGYSLTTIPHAMSRDAVERMGYESLMIPPKALAIGYLLGLRVVPVHYVPVGNLNPLKRVKVNGKDPLESLIIGDHLEALASWMKHRGVRGGFNDGVRKREKVTQG